MVLVLTAMSTRCSGRGGVLTIRHHTSHMPVSAQCLNICTRTDRDFERCSSALAIGSRCLEKQTSAHRVIDRRETGQFVDFRSTFNSDSHSVFAL